MRCEAGITQQRPIFYSTKPTFDFTATRKHLPTTEFLASDFGFMSLLIVPVHGVYRANSYDIVSLVCVGLLTSWRRGTDRGRAVRPHRAPHAWLDGAHQAASNHLGGAFSRPRHANIGTT